MPESEQPDLFGYEGGPEPFGEDTPAPVYRPDPTKVRARLHKMLYEARAAETLPWDEESARLYRAIFPQMTRSLPEEEAARLRLEFEAEMERLKAA